ncbi:unnamed protein product [Meloidogyne enterolobii]|uniref:Uncharacterized protein n=1 Tax=Meloidogyne enterolobii TaxID=390850 RepID=A0ACB1A0H6_MELEN
MDALMDSLNDSIPMPFGVRRLHTPNGKTPIRSIDELQPHGRYIAASSTRRVQGVDLEAIERRKRHREDAQRRWNFQSSPTTTHGGSANTGQIQLTASKGGAAEINVSLCSIRKIFRKFLNFLKFSKKIFKIKFSKI